MDTYGAANSRMKLIQITGMANRRQDELDEAQIKLALQAKYYLLAALIFFELLIWWR